MELELDDVDPTSTGDEDVRAKLTAAKSGLPPGVTTRVDRLLQERIRRNRSQQQFDYDEAAYEGPLDSSHEYCPTSERLVVVANRLPVTCCKDATGAWQLQVSAGGLVSALKGVSTYKTVWIGWPGIWVKAGRERDALGALLMQEGCVPVWIDPTLLDMYYNGFCNSVLWQLFHYVPLNIDSWQKMAEQRAMQMQWQAYQVANQKFADVVLDHYQPNDIMWVQDYHLMLLPSLLKAVVPKMKVGFFLHTPFPSSEIYRTLPVREEVLRAVLGADLIGFHTYDYARHFISSCTRILGLEGTPEGVENAGCITRVGTFPIGIDPERFTLALEGEEVQGHVAKLLNRYAGRKIMLGVDRLDMVKGIPQKLLAFEKFLEEHPEWRDKVLLVQIAVPSRTDVPEYQKLRSMVHEIVGRINGAFGTLTYVPIYHLDTSLSFTELCALYAVTDVALVTSLRDGMNLVSYEYVACQSDNAGVLVLSEFAGAAQSLGAGALLVNPWNITDMAQAIEDALCMGEEERRERHRQNYMHVQTHTAQNWADTFISELNDTHIEADLRTRHAPPPLDVEECVNSFKASKRRLIILGYNATLTTQSEVVMLGRGPPLSGSRRQYSEQLKALARVNPQVTSSIQELCKDPANAVVIFSGSETHKLENIFGDLPVWLAAENGVFVRPPAALCNGSGPMQMRHHLKRHGVWHQLFDSIHSEWMESVQLVFDYFCERTPRSFVEVRETSLVWNYKHADHEFGRIQARDLLQHLWTGPISNAPVEIIQGGKSVEVRPVGVTKGLALQRCIGLMAEIMGPVNCTFDFVLCIGHLLGRDENMYSLLEGVNCEAGHAAPPAPPPAPPASAASASAPALTANPEARSHTAPSATAITPSPHLPSPPSADTPSSRTLTTHPPPARHPSRATPSSHPPLPPQLPQPRPGTSAFSTANRLEGLLQSEALQDQLPSPAVARQQRRQARLQARYQAAQAWQRQGRQGSGQDQGSVPLSTSQQPTLQQRLARLQERMRQQAEQQQQLGLGNAGSSGQLRGPAAAGQLHVGLDRVRSLTSDSLLLAPFALHPCVAMTSGIVRPGRLVHIPNPPSGDVQGHAPAPHQLPAHHEARPAPRPLAIPAHLAFPSNAFLPLPLASATARPSAPLPWNTHNHPSPSAAATSPSPSAGASGGARPASAPLSGLNRGFLAPRGSSSSRQRATAPPVLASRPPPQASPGPGSSPTAGQAAQPSSAITTGPAGAHGGRGSAAARPPPGSQAGSSNSLARGFLARPAASIIPRQSPAARAGSLASEPTHAAGSSGGPGGFKGCLSPVVEAQVAGSPGSSSGSLAGMAAGSGEERLRQQSDNQKVAGHTTSRRAAGGQDRVCNAGQSAHGESSGAEEEGASGSDSDIPGLLTEEEMGPALHHSADKPACLQQGRQQQGGRSQATDSSRAGGSGQGRGLRSGFMVSRGPGAGTATGASTGLPAAAHASVASSSSTPPASPSQLQDSALDSKNTVMPAAPAETAAPGSAAGAAAELQNPQASHTPAPSLGRSPSSGRSTRYASSCCPPASLQPPTSSSSSSLLNLDAPPSTSTTPGSSASPPSISIIPAAAPPSTASPSNPSPLPLPLPLHPSFGGEASSSAPLPSLPPLQHPIQVSPAAVQHTLRMLHRTASGATPLDQAVQAAVQELSQEAGQQASPSSRPHQPSPLPLLLDSLTALTSPRELPAVQLVSHTSLPSPRTAGRAGARAAARAAAGTASSPGQAAAGAAAAGGEVVGQGGTDLPSPTPGSGGEVSPVVPGRGGSGRRSWQLPGSAQRGVLSLPAAHPGVVTYVHDDTLGRTFTTQEPGGGGAGEAGLAGAGDEQAGSAAGERSDAVLFNLPPLALTPLPSVVLSQPPSALSGSASVTAGVSPAQAAPQPASGQEVGKAEEAVTTATVGASSGPGAAGGSKEQAGCGAGPLPEAAGAEGASPAAGAAAISGGDVAGEDASLLLDPPAAASHPGSPGAHTPRTAPPVLPGASSSSYSSTGSGSRGTGGSPGQANVVNSLARVVAAPVRWLLGLPRRHP